jgi:prefoldin subunit 5
MSDYTDIDMEFRNYQDRIADLEARIEALEAALRKIMDHPAGLSEKQYEIARAALEPR